MTEEQVKAVSQFRVYLADIGYNVDNLTDDQLLESVNKSFEKIAEAFIPIQNMMRRYLKAIAPKLKKLEDEQTRQRRLLYRKKKSQAKRKA